MVPYSLIENEDAFKQNLTNVNNANHTARNELFKVAMANENGRYDADRSESDAKEHCQKILEKWSVPLMFPMAKRLDNVEIRALKGMN